MTSVAKAVIGLDELGFTTRGSWKTFAAGILGFLAVALYAVYTTAPAWHLLGVGRPVVPEGLFPLTAMAVLLITTGGLAVAFGGATMSLLALWQVLGKGVSFAAVRVFAGVSYLFVTLLPTIFIYLYGIPRRGLAEWLLSQNPDAYQVLFGMHGVVELSHFVLALLGIGLLWGVGDKLRTSRVAQAAFVVVLLLTFFSISLTLGFHSTLVRIHIG
ncbi:MAG: hypothetical protein ACE5I9_06970 [Candidatus Methylomirabilales bacterium]